MKFSVFLSHMVYCEIEVEAEDYTDAAQRVALAAAIERDFVLHQPAHMMDDLEVEVVTVADKLAVNGDIISLADYNSKVVVFDSATVNSWLGDLSPNLVQIAGEGRRVLDEDKPT